MLYALSVHNKIYFKRILTYIGLLIFVLTLGLLTFVLTLVENYSESKVLILLIVMRIIL